MVLIKPLLDNNNYKLIKLDNNMEILLIYDKTTPFSATSLSVNIGSYDENIPGLAHFLEHMLFMGTEKYPKENYFHKYISEHGGVHNAYTDSQITNYFYDVQNEYYLKSLDIFAQFFICPLFSKNMVDREIESVNEEHNKNISNDIRRIKFLFKQYAENNHPSKRFSTGNSNTLKREDIYDKLKEFYNKNYSSNLMKLVILSKINLNILEEHVNQIFSKIKNKNTVKKKYGLPYNFIPRNNICSKLLKIVPTMDGNLLYIIWQMPEKYKFYKSKPSEYIAHLLGHEGKGSIIFNLRKAGWCTNIYAGEFGGDESSLIFSLVLTLTKNGIKYVPRILQLIYEYINLIREKGITDTIYNENKRMSELNFKYMEKIYPIDSVSELSRNMFYYENEDIIYGPYRYEKYSDSTYKKIEECLDNLTPNKSLIGIVSKKYQNIVSKKEKYYGIEYECYSNPKNLGHEFKKSDNKFIIKLPKRNIFIPDNLDLVKTNSNNKYPIPLINETNRKLWYKHDNKFHRPNGIVGTILYYKNLIDDPRKFVLINLYIAIVNYLLTSPLYYAHLAGLEVDINISLNYLNIMVKGYNDKMNILLENVIKIIKNIKITEEVFNINRDEYIKNIKNILYESPYKLGLEYLLEKSYKKYYNSETIIKILRDIEYYEILQYKNYLGTSDEMECLIQGNITKNDSRRLFKNFDQLFNGNSEKIRLKTLKIIKQLKSGFENIHSKKALNDNEVNSGLVIFIEIGYIKKQITPKWINYRCSLMILDKIIKEKYFDQLRTKEQLGYIVDSFADTLGDNKFPVVGMIFTVQSSKEAEYLEDRTKKFIKKIGKILDKVDDSKLNKVKKIIKIELMIDNLNLGDEFRKNFIEIINGDHIFNIREIYTKYMDRIKISDIREFYGRYFVNETTRKMRIIKIDNKNI